MKYLKEYNNHGVSYFTTNYSYVIGNTYVFKYSEVLFLSDYIKDLGVVCKFYDRSYNHRIYDISDMSGVYSINIYPDRNSVIYIRKKENEWFSVFYYNGNKKNKNRYYKCDQISGVVDLLRDLNIGKKS